MATAYYRDHESHREPEPPPGGYRYAPRRDALTGEPIRSNTIHRAVRADERADNPPTRAQHADGWRADLTARPLRLHTRAVETAADAGDTRRGALGGHAFSRQFAIYLARVQPVALAEADAEARRWWLSSYGRARVRNRFHARYGYARGDLAYQVALAVASGYYAADDAAGEVKRSVFWVAYVRDLAQRFATTPASAFVGGENAAKVNHIPAAQRARARLG